MRIAVWTKTQGEIDFFRNFILSNNCRHYNEELFRSGWFDLCQSREPEGQLAFSVELKSGSGKSISDYSLCFCDAPWYRDNGWIVVPLWSFMNEYYKANRDVLKLFDVINERRRDYE